MGPPDSLCHPSAEHPAASRGSQPWLSPSPPSNSRKIVRPQNSVCFSSFLKFKWDMSLLPPPLADFLKGYSVTPSHTQASIPPCQAPRDHKPSLQAALLATLGAQEIWQTQLMLHPPAPHRRAQTLQGALGHPKPPLLLPFPSVAVGTPWGHISQAATEE